jgi:hypothetical protein
VICLASFLAISKKKQEKEKRINNFLGDWFRSIKEFEFIVQLLRYFKLSNCIASNGYAFMQAGKSNSCLPEPLPNL